MANLQQKRVLDVVTAAVNSGAGGLFLIDGPGGTGKTLVKNLLLSYVRSTSGIALSVASLHLSSSTVDELHIHDSRFPRTFNKTVSAT